MSRRRWWRRVVPVAVVTVIAVALGACGTPSPSVLGPRIVDLGRDAGRDVAPIDPARRDVLASGDLRLQLEELLGVHGALTVEMMRETSVGAPTSAAWTTQLAQNTAELAGVIGLVYGPLEAKAFDQLWSFHTQFLLSYSDAVRRHDQAGTTAALTSLDSFRADFSSYLATATAGRIPPAAVSALVETHVDHMIRQLDAFHAGDLAGAISEERAGHTNLSTIGAVLGAAIAQQFPAAFPPAADDGAVVFCSILGGRLTAVVDAVTTTATLPAGDPDGLTYTRSVLDVLGQQANTDLSHVYDPLSSRGGALLATQLSARLGAQLTPELRTDAETIGSLGARITAADRDPNSTPVAVRDAYAAAYRLATAIGHLPDRTPTGRGAH